jgi:hypothetical protein
MGNRSRNQPLGGPPAKANWDRKLAWPVTVRDGEAVATLSDARRLILNLPDSIQQRVTWQGAAEVLLMAAESGSDGDIEQATLQIERALIHDGRLRG